MHRIGFKRCEVDHCCYVKFSDNSYIILLLYVDDMLIAGSSIKEINNLKKQLSKQFAMKGKGMAIGWVDLDAKDIEVGTVETIVVFLDTHLLRVCGYGLTCGLCPCMPLYPHLPRLQPAPGAYKGIGTSSFRQ